MKCLIKWPRFFAYTTKSLGVRLQLASEGLWADHRIDANSALLMPFHNLHVITESLGWVGMDESGGARTAFGFTQQISLLKIAALMSPKKALF